MSLDSSPPLFTHPSNMRVRALGVQELDLLKKSPRELLDLGSNAHSLVVDIKALRAEAVCTELLTLAKQQQDLALLVQWEGNKIPRGLFILGHEVSWTQNGIVTSTKRDNLGFYDRLLEFGGKAKNEHAMVIYVKKSLKFLGGACALVGIGTYGFSRQRDSIEEVKAQVSNTFSSPQIVVSTLFGFFEPLPITFLKWCLLKNPSQNA